MKPKSKLAPGCQQEPCSVSSWEVIGFPSGTIIVQNSNRKDDPHYYIWQPAADSDEQRLRYEIATELKTWLNGAEEPWWLELLHRDGAESATTPHGSNIMAVGPFEKDDAGGLLPHVDQGSDAKIARGLMIDALMKRKQPDV